MAWITEAIEEVIREAVAPPLKAGGFRKRQRNWYRRVNDCGQAVNVQGHGGNVAEGGSFTLNVGLWYSGIDDGELPDFAREVSCPRRMRVGYLLDERRDFWWILSADHGVEGVVDEVNALVVERLVPFLDKSAKPLGLLEWELRHGWVMRGADPPFRDVDRGELRPFVQEGLLRFDFEPWPTVPRRQGPLLNDLMYVLSVAHWCDITLDRDVLARIQTRLSSVRLPGNPNLVESATGAISHFLGRRPSQGS